MNAILTIIGLVIAAIAWVEGVVRNALAGSGIDHQMENIIMVTVAVLLIIGAFRLFGGVLAVLCTLLLLLMVIHVLAPGVLPGAEHV